jgi:hypothetical protein
VSDLDACHNEGCAEWAGAAPQARTKNTLYAGLERDSKHIDVALAEPVAAGWA